MFLTKKDLNNVNGFLKIVIEYSVLFACLFISIIINFISNQSKEKNI